MLETSQKKSQKKIYFLLAVTAFFIFNYYEYIEAKRIWLFRLALIFLYTILNFDQKARGLKVVKLPGGLLYRIHSLLFKSDSSYFEAQKRAKKSL